MYINSLLIIKQIKQHVLIYRRPTIYYEKYIWIHIIADLQSRQFRQFLQVILWCELLGMDVLASYGPVSSQYVWCGADNRDTGTAVPYRTRAVCVAAGCLFGCIFDHSNRIHKSLQYWSAPLNLQAISQFSWTNNIYGIYLFLTSTIYLQIYLLFFAKVTLLETRCQKGSMVIILSVRYEIP